jgi:DNA processing protein
MNVRGGSTQLGSGALPPRLLDLRRPPRTLYLRGDLPRAPAVAIVGTRRPSDDARHFARTLAAELAGEGVAVLSGGAAGIDTEAHLGALDARGVTVVVAPAGFDRPFPEQNAELFREVVERGGAYLSLVPDGVAAKRGSFFRRNACLVALSHLVVVVEAPFRSGACNAAAHARRLGRPLYVVPHAPWHALGRGCLLELKRGARPLESAKDLLRALAEARLHVVAAPPAGSSASGVQACLDFSGPDEPSLDPDRIVSALRAGAEHADGICELTGLSSARVQHGILTLTLGGVLVADPAGRLRLL